LSNVIRNLALNTNTGIPPVTRCMNRLLAGLHDLTGRALNDPATTYYVGGFGFVDEFVVYDSYASNPYHGVLILVAVGFALGGPRKWFPLLLYAAVLAAGFILFCLLIRWAQWHTRLQLGFFVLSMPLVALVMTAIFPVG